LRRAGLPRLSLHYAAFAACRSLRAVQINSVPQLLHTNTMSSMLKSG
jgi:hypothetical protein